MTTCADNFRSKALRAFLALALIVLPLTPFSVSQAWAESPEEQSEQPAPISITCKFADRVALGQQLAIDITLSNDAPLSTTTTAGEGEEPIVENVDYTASVQYMGTDGSGAYKEIVSAPVNFASSRTAGLTVALNKSQWEWALDKTILFRVEVTNSLGSSASRVGYVSIDPAYRTVSFNTNVASDDPNQASCDTSSIKVTYNREYSYDVDNPSVPRSLPVSTRPNYDFAGWYTNKNCTGAAVTATSTSTLVADATLYAKWIGKSYVVSLNAGRGFITNSSGARVYTVNVTYGDKYSELAKLTPQGTDPDNMEFRGWNTVADGSGANITASTVVDSTLIDWTVFNSQTLYAQWGPIRNSVEGAVVEGLEETYAYTGKAIEPAFVVKAQVRNEAGEPTGTLVTLVKDVDYTITYGNNVELTTSDSMATATIEGKGVYKGTLVKTFAIGQGTPYFEVNGSDVVPTNAPDSAVSQVTAHFPASGPLLMQVKLVTGTLDVKYTLDITSGSSNAALFDSGTGALIIKNPCSLVLRAEAPATDKFSATLEGGSELAIKVDANAFSASLCALSQTKFSYDGKAHKPNVTLFNNKGQLLTNGIDYTVKYPSGCKSVGTYTVTIEGLGGYEGNKTTRTFTIAPKAPSTFKASRTGTIKQNGKTYGVYKVKWSKTSGIDGYQIKQTVTASKTRTFKASVTSQSFGWMKGKTVKVQIRTYKKVGTKKYYSDWKTINVTVK